MERFVFDNEGDFLAKLRELIKGGTKSKDIEIIAPHPCHHAEEILDQKPSYVRLFALVGALIGAATGYAITSGTVLDWPLITGGKQTISIPPFTVIAFELMILFGSLGSFLGFIILSRLPAVRTIISDDEFTDNFEIHVKTS